MNNRIKQLFFMGLCSLLVFNKVIAYHFNLGSGLSVTNITSSSFDNYEGNRNAFSKASLVKTPHITFSIGHIFKTVYSPLTGSNDATFILDAMFYGAWLKQAFKMVFQNDTNGSNNLYTLQDLEDIRVYFLGSYQLYSSIPIKSNSWALFLTTGIGLAFTLFNNLTFYESLTDAAIGNSLKGGHPIVCTPYISLNWHYSFENSFFIKASY